MPFFIICYGESGSKTGRKGTLRNVICPGGDSTKPLLLSILASLFISTPIACQLDSANDKTLQITAITVK